jgi:CheY-like chemotaxis protein
VKFPRPYPAACTRDESAASATYTILVVDDGPGLLELVTEVLSEDGDRVLVASSGEDALTMIRAVHPDLILLDYIVPDVNGLVLRPLEDG